MKFLINTLLFLTITILFENNAFALSNNQIRAICQKKQWRSKCIKDYKSKKINLIQGNKIEIPVVPFKK